MNGISPTLQDVVIEDNDSRGTALFVISSDPCRSMTLDLVTYGPASNWTTVTDGSLSVGDSSYHFTAGLGSWVSCSFNGIHIFYIANRKYNHATFGVSIDDGPTAVFSSYNTALQLGQVLFHQELPPGNHKINITNLENMTIGLDRFVYVLRSTCTY